MAQTYWIYVGMQGCSNMHFAGDCDANTQEEADHYAWDLACEEYDSFAGYHGIPDEEDIREELLEGCDDGEEPTEDDVRDCYGEYVSDHVSYWAIPAREGVDPEDEDFIMSKPWYEKEDD